MHKSQHKLFTESSNTIFTFTNLGYWTDLCLLHLLINPLNYEEMCLTI
jgi:hypothetical protein